MKHLLAVLFLVLVLGCSEKKSTDAEECYRLWSGMKSPKEIKVLKGSYWQSAHFTKEYIVFLEIQVSDRWAKQFITENKLIATGGNWSEPGNLPEWFKPPQLSKQWKLPDVSTDSRYFEDTITGRFFLYETQL
jgi:hypothetical protein